MMPSPLSVVQTHGARERPYNQLWIELYSHSKPGDPCTMSRSSKFVTALAVAALALAPSLADARAGSGSSFGSRGSRTYSAPPATNTAPYTASPMERSMTPRSAPGYGNPGYNP